MDFLRPNNLLIESSDDKGLIFFRGKPKSKSWNVGFFSRWEYEAVKMKNPKQNPENKDFFWQEYEAVRMRWGLWNINLPSPPLQDVFLCHKNWLSNVNIFREIWSNINIGWQIYPSNCNILQSVNKVLWFWNFMNKDIWRW